MATSKENELASVKNRATAERKSDRELVVTRMFNGPVRLVYQAWSKPELFARWWLPKSIGLTLHSCEMDVRTGGRYRLVISLGEQTNEFYGKYLEVIPNSRIVWTNEEGGEGGQITTVTFEEDAGKTRLTVSELYPTKEALDAAIASGEIEKGESFDQLDELLVTLAANGGRS